MVAQTIAYLKQNFNNLSHIENYPLGPNENLTEWGLKCYNNITLKDTMTTKNEKLLKNKQAVEEINRHRWIESEKIGHDIGFETASMDWLEKFSAAWMQYHMPQRKSAAKASSRKASKPAKRRARTK